MAYTLANLQSDIRSYTEVSDTVLTEGVLEKLKIRGENKFGNLIGNSKMVNINNL